MTLMAFKKITLALIDTIRWRNLGKNKMKRKTLVKIRKP